MNGHRAPLYSPCAHRLRFREVQGNAAFELFYRGIEGSKGRRVEGQVGGPDIWGSGPRAKAIGVGSRRAR